MKKGILLLLIGLLSLAVFTDIGLANEKSKPELIYSNLVDQPVQSSVTETLKYNHIPYKDYKHLIENVNRFNRAVGYQSLVKKGFKTSKGYHIPYDEELLEQKWDKKYPDEVGLNCRLTAFSILKNTIHIKNTSKPDLETLAFDNYALQNSQLLKFTPSEQKVFKKLFGAIKVGSTANEQSQLNAVLKYYRANGIHFNHHTTASMISVYIPSDIDGERKLFIGHVGVLMKQKDGHYLFLEKLAFKKPYQAIKFKNKMELKRYLLTSYKAYSDQKLKTPIIIENDHLLK